MARPRSEDKRSAILAAAIRVIAAQGLGAPTATITKEAKVSTGSLFVYFPTKAELLNQLYVELKTEMGNAALEGMPSEGDDREKVRSMWTHWLRWATTFPEKRRVLALLGVADDITAASRSAGHQSMAAVARLLDRVRQSGPMHEAPLGFVVGLMNALAETTIDFMIREPASAERRSVEAFDALWRIVS